MRLRLEHQNPNTVQARAGYLLPVSVDGPAGSVSRYQSSYSDTDEMFLNLLENQPVQKMQ